MSELALAKVENMALAAQGIANDAKHIAEKAVMEIAHHNEICAERYQNIKDQNSEIREDLKVIPTIFNEIGKVKQLVYIGVGIWIGAPVVGGAILGIMKLTGH